MIIPAGGAQGERNLSEGTTALALDIDQDGGLVVQYRDGSIDTLNSGDQHQDHLLLNPFALLTVMV